MGSVNPLTLWQGEEESVAEKSVKARRCATLILEYSLWRICSTSHLGPRYHGLHNYFRPHDAVCMYVWYRGIERDIHSLADKLEELSAALMTIQVCPHPDMRHHTHTS